MRKVSAAALWLLIAGGACKTERIELLPGQLGSDSGTAIDLGVRAEAGEPAEAGAEAGVEADGGDAEVSDLGADSGIFDAGITDSGSSCVCRYRMCRLSPECTAPIGEGSSCDPPDFYCSGSVGTCRMDVDCGGANLVCTAASDSIAPCP